MKPGLTTFIDDDDDDACSFCHHAAHDDGPCSGPGTFVGTSCSCAIYRRPQNMKKIAITKRSHDVAAYVEGEPGKWGCGGSADEAVGSLVRSWPEEFGVGFVDPQLGGGPPANEVEGFAAGLVVCNPRASVGELVEKVMRHFGGKCNPKAAVQAVVRAQSK